MTMLPAIFGIGLAAMLLALALQPRLIDLYRRHCDFVTTVAMRFSPRPVNAANIVLSIYSGFIILLLILLMVTPSPLIALGVWSLSWFLPGLITNSMWKRRRKKIDMQLPAAISMLANCVRSGLTLIQSVRRLTQTCQEPVRTEFQILYNRYAHGMDLERSILEVKDRLRLENFNLFASALLINRELGGNIALTLDRIAGCLIKLSQMRRSVEVHTAEGRMNIKVLLAAPVIMLLMLSSVDSEGVGLLFTTLQGWAVLMVAGLLIGFGLFWATKIVSSEV